MERLKDPLNDRNLPDLLPPPSEPLSRSLLFPSNSITPNIPNLKLHLESGGSISKADFLQITSLASQLLSQESNLLELNDPVSIIGDIHGQFYDFLNIIELAGELPTTKYLFLGDFVDRGSFSIEVLALLYTLKINFPSNVFILRGNHESRQLTTFFNFRKECLVKYDIETYDAVMNSFDQIPLACIVNKKFFAVHGGISPSLKTLKDLLDMPRKMEPPRSGLFCDLLWADPIDSETGSCIESFKPNEIRGCSYFFTAASTKEFLKKNKLLSIIRAHEAQIDGYKMHKWNGTSEFPLVFTVFSAPNYCDVYNNKGAILMFSNNSLHVKQYNYTVHPYILPGFMNAFEWSIPFVVEKVLQIIQSFINSSEKIVAGDEDKGEAGREKAEMVKKKIKAVSKLMKMFNLLRGECELVSKLKGMCPDNKIPRGLLEHGKEAIVGAIESFNTAKRWDIVNEKRPEDSNLLN